MNEADIEQSFLLPLLNKLGWSLEEIHAKVPINFRQGTRVGRKPEADFVMAAPLPKPPKQGYLVAEAKALGDPLDNAADQAFSYAAMLRAPFYLCTNGRKIQVWRTGFLKESTLLLEVNGLEEIASRFGDIELKISKNSIIEWINQHKLIEQESHDPNLDDYLIHLGQLTAQSILVPRIVRERTKDARDIVIEDETSSDIPFPVERWNHFCGLGGRGKSTILLLLLKKLLRGTGPKRVPILLSLAHGKGSLFERLALSIGRHCHTLSSATAVAAWLRQKQAFLLLDDWDRLTDLDRPIIEEEIDSSMLSNCMIVSVGRPNIRFPKTHRLAIYDVSVFREEEASALVSKVLGAGLAEKFLDSAPSAIKPLVHEPVILDKLLQLGNSGSLSPHLRLPELFENLIHNMLISRHDRVAEQIQRLNTVCKHVAHMNNFSRLEISQSISINDLTASVDQIIDELISISIIHNPTGSPGIFEFSHSVWQSYFIIQSIFDSVNKQTSAEQLVSLLGKWLNDRDIDSRRQDIHFLLGILPSGNLQDVVMDFLMRRDVALYLLAIREANQYGLSENSFEASRDALRDYYQGYFGFLEHCGPALRPLLIPWKRTEDEFTSLQFYGAIIGFRSGDSLVYTLSLSESKANIIMVDQHVSVNKRDPLGTSIKFASRQVNVNILNEPIRLMAMNDIVKQIREIIKQSRNGRCPLPVFDAEWLVRERLDYAMRYAARTVLYSFDEPPANLTPRRILEWSHRHEKHENGTLRAIVFSRNSFIENQRIVIADISRDAERLIGLGLADTPLHSLSLPGPDMERDDNENDGQYENLYTDAAAVLYLKKLFGVLSETYKYICETYFAAFKDLFFYRVGPFKAFVEIDPWPLDSAARRGKWRRGWTYWFEPTESWSEVPEVTIDSDKRQDYDNIKYRYRNKCANLNRFDGSFRLTSTAGSWSPYEARVSNFLSDLLEDDLDQILECIYGSAWDMTH